MRATESARSENARNLSRLFNESEYTKFVIEGRRGGEGQSGDEVQVFSRYLEFPDGTFFPLPAHTAQRKSGAHRRSGKARTRRH